LARRLLVVAFAVAFALLPTTAFAHAQLVSSDPAPDAVLETLPVQVSLAFNEPVTPAGPGIRVYSPSGGQVAGQTRRAGNRLVATLGESQGLRGTYVVLWQVEAADTHPSRGAFSFSVGSRTANPYAGLLNGAAIGTTSPLGLVLQAFAHWLHFAGYALAFGVAAYFALVRREPRLKRLIRAGLALLLVAEPLALVAQLASLSFDADTLLGVLSSGFGRLLGLRLAGALMLWALLALESPWPILALGAVLALVDGAGGHAIPGLPGLGPALDATHVGAMGVWAGGLVAYLVAPDRRFGRVALLSFGTAATTGILLALFHGLPAQLFGSDFGRALLLKIGLLAAAVGLGAAGRRRAEAIAVATVLLAASLLVSLPPPI